MIAQQNGMVHYYIMQCVRIFRITLLACMTRIIWERFGYVAYWNNVACPSIDVSEWYMLVWAMRNMQLSSTNACSLLLLKTRELGPWMMRWWALLSTKLKLCHCCTPKAHCMKVVLVMAYMCMYILLFFQCVLCFMCNILVWAIVSKWGGLCGAGRHLFYII